MSYLSAPAEQSINPKALTWAIGVHVLLFLLFLLWQYKVPVAVAPVEMGMEVNLGTSDNGSGTDQPMSTEDPASGVSVNLKSASASSNTSKDLMQSNDVNAPAVPMANKANNTNRNSTLTNNETKKTANQQANDKNKKQQLQPRYVYNGGTGKGGNSAMQNINGKGEGNTTGPGDRGVPGGTPGSANYVGSPGNGTGGINHTLSGRQISPDKFEASFHEGGTVKIRVTVDRNGNIIDKSVQSSPSPELSRLALQKLSQAKFSPSPDAQPQQFGTVTIVFKTGA